MSKLFNNVDISWTPLHHFSLNVVCDCPLSSKICSLLQSFDFLNCLHKILIYLGTFKGRSSEVKQKLKYWWTQLKNWYKLHVSDQNFLITLFSFLVKNQRCLKEFNKFNTTFPNLVNLQEDILFLNSFHNKSHQDLRPQWYVLFIFCPVKNNKISQYSHYKFSYLTARIAGPTNISFCRCWLKS